MTELGVFDYIGRSMERLGFLKRLIKRVSSTNTSNLENLGNDLITTVSQKIRVLLSVDLYQYNRSRIRGDSLKPYQTQINLWLKQNGPAPDVTIELQDLYLSDNRMPSQVGRLVKDNWRRYPALGTNLGLIRKGTFSITTRGLSFLNLIPESDNIAFTDYLPESNPLLISEKQGLLLLYSFLENDCEVLIPLWKEIQSHFEYSFSEKDAGAFLPGIYTNVISKYRRKSIGIDLRERLEVLEKTAKNIQNVPKKGYGGTSPLDTAVRPRLEPFVDIGLFTKEDRTAHDFCFTQNGNRFITSLPEFEDIKEFNSFLFLNYFSAIAGRYTTNAQYLSDNLEIIERLKNAAKAISSSSGYTPIEELGLLAGIDALIDENKILEIGSSREALLAYQKSNPYKVRFTVDRMGVLAHAKFVNKTND